MCEHQVTVVGSFGGNGEGFHLWLVKNYPFNNIAKPDYVLIVSLMFVGTCASQNGSRISSITARVTWKKHISLSVDKEPQMLESCAKCRSGSAGLAASVEWMDRQRFGSGHLFTLIVVGRRCISFPAFPFPPLSSIPPPSPPPHCNQSEEGS